jgi:hypothetical protein
MAIAAETRPHSPPPGQSNCELCEALPKRATLTPSSVHTSNSAKFMMPSERGMSEVMRIVASVARAVADPLPIKLPIAVLEPLQELVAVGEAAPLLLALPVPVALPELVALALESALEVAAADALPLKLTVAVPEPLPVLELDAEAVEEEEGHAVPLERQEAEEVEPGEDHVPAGQGIASTVERGQ